MKFCSNNKQYQGDLGDLKTFFIDNQNKMFICYRVNNKHDKQISCWGEILTESQALSMLAYTFSHNEENLNYFDWDD